MFVKQREGGREKERERERGSGGDQEGDWCPSQPDATLKQTPPLSVDSALGLRLRETARTAGS